MATFTWTSTKSGDWNTASNWSPATVPNASNADVLITTPGTYTVTIAAGASDAVHSVALDSAAGTLEVDGTLDFTGGPGDITGPLQAVLTMNGGTIVNGGTMNPNFLVNSGTAVFTGTNGIYFNNGITAIAATTALISPSGGLAEYTGTTLFDGVFDANNGTIDIGGTLNGASSVAFNIQTLEGPPLNPAGYTDIILIGSASVVNEWNGTKYVPVESTLNTITSRGTVFALNRDWTTSNALTIDNGGLMFLSAGSLSATGGLTVKSGGTLEGSSSTFGSPIVNNGTVLAAGGVLLLQGSVSGSGVLGFDSGAHGTLEIAGTTGNPVLMAGTTTLQLDSPSNYTGTVSAGGSDTIILQGITADSAVLNGSTLSVKNGGTQVYALATSGLTGDTFSVSMVGGNAKIDIVCFARGTRIKTIDGDVPVEQLAVGQQVITASGQKAPITWVGRRRIDCRRHPEPWRVWPVRISAGAFGPNLPKRDLVVSPQHAIYDEGVLVPARFLVNDTTIVQEPVGQVEYFHVELPKHDLLIAEGLSTESYLENGDRNCFEDQGTAMVLHPDFSRWSWDARACAELKVTGPELQAIGAKLERRAASQRRAAAARRSAA